MSKKRFVDTKFWTDNYIVDKDPVEKLLFLYLLTNPLTNIIGIYEISIKQIAFDTGIDQDMVLKILGRFEEDGKIKYKKGWLALKNFVKHQVINASVIRGMARLIKDTPKELVDWIEFDKNFYQKIGKPLKKEIKKKEKSNIPATMRELP